MLQQNSKEFRAFFLLQFTKELIKHTEVYKESILKKEVRHVIKEEAPKESLITSQEKKDIHKVIKEKGKQDIQRTSQLEKEEPLIDKNIPPQKKLFKPLPRPPVVKRTSPRVLRIPAPKLPPRLQYIRPIPTNIQIDLGKLNPLIKDPAIKTMECNGPDQNITVEGTMGRKKTDIILSKEEIYQVIKKFSEIAKIPYQEGIFRVAAGRLILSAIISGVIGSKFIIKKIGYAPALR